LGTLLFILLIVIVIVIRLFVPKIKGQIGESIVSRILERFQSDNYAVINDLTIKSNNRSSQIDHIVICPFGIVVIETKNYTGWIFGNEFSTNWTQVIYKEKFKHYNPIRQNRGHINALKYHLPRYSHIPYYSIIVLAGSCEFKTFDEVKTPVVYPNDLYETIINLEGKQVLSWKDIVDINNTLNRISLGGEISESEHIKNTRKSLTESFNVYIVETCPECGGNLVERNGKYGIFLGCSKYPKCKFTKSKDDETRFDS